MKRLLFLSILERFSDEDAEPLVVSNDPELIRIVGRELARRLGADAEPGRVRKVIKPDGYGRVSAGVMAVDGGPGKHGEPQ